MKILIRFDWRVARQKLKTWGKICEFDGNDYSTPILSAYVAFWMEINKHKHKGAPQIVDCYYSHSHEGWKPFALSNYDTDSVLHLIGKDDYPEIGGNKIPKDKFDALIENQEIEHELPNHLGLTTDQCAQLFELQELYSNKKTDDGFKKTILKILGELNGEQLMEISEYILEN